MGSANITFIGAFVAGLLSFLSPCVLPLIPINLAILGAGTRAASTTSLRSAEPP